MTLHIVNKSPAQTQCLQDCIASAAVADEILLIEDGVYATEINNPHYALLAKCKQAVYALSPDLEARGLSKLTGSSAAIITDQGFVELTVKHQAILSWY